MHIGEVFAFNLDAPREQPANGPAVHLAGWLAAKAPISDLQLLGGKPRPLTLSPRPDVQAIFPGYPHVTGFIGEASGRDLENGALRFGFRLGGVEQQFETPLPAPPPAVSGWKRLLAQWAAKRARRDLANNPSRATQWNAGMRALLAEVRLARGEAFGRVEGERIIELFAHTFPDAMVVQIGANDGTTGDPLVTWFAQTRWRGLLVEPIGHLVDALRHLHAERPHVVIDRVAISETNGTARIYRLAHEPGKSPVWHQLLATFDRELLLKHRASIPNVNELIIEEAVETITVPTLLARHQVDAIDLLMIDTEGHDYRILRQFDLRRVRPFLLIFEHQHLRAEEKQAAHAMLRSQGYRWIETPEGDTFAWRQA